MMLPQLSLLLAILAAVHAGGEFLVLQSPDVEFTVNGETLQISFMTILSAALGYTGKPKDSEHSIAIWDLVPMPKVFISIDGVEQLPSLNDKTKVIHPLIVDEAEETWQAIRSRVEERSNDNTLVRINLSDGVDALDQLALGELKPVKIEKLKTLNLEIEENRKFVEEMQLLHVIADNAFSVKKHYNDTLDLWLIVSALNTLFDLHENNSPAAVEEAYTLLNKELEHVSNAFVNAYDGKIVIAAFTNDAGKVRNASSVLEK